MRGDCDGPSKWQASNLVSYGRGSGLQTLRQWLWGFRGQAAEVSYHRSIQRSARGPYLWLVPTRVIFLNQSNAVHFARVSISEHTKWAFGLGGGVDQDPERHCPIRNGRLNWLLEACQGGLVSVVSRGEAPECTYKNQSASNARPVPTCPDVSAAAKNKRGCFVSHPMHLRC